jgi:hypothetical protein
MIIISELSRKINFSSKERTKDCLHEVEKIIKKSELLS